MDKLTDILTALNQYIKQYHWLAKGYDNHILADKLGENLTESIDRLKELHLGSGGSEDIALAEKSLAGAVDTLRATIKEPANTTDMVLENIGYLIIAFLTAAKDVKQSYEGTIFAGGINNAIDDISEQLIRNAYLLGIQLEKGK